MRVTKTIVLPIVLGFGLLPGIGYAQLTIDFVSNAASFIFPPLPNASIAQGGFFVILGSGGPAGSETSLWGTYPLPTTLDGISVTVTVGNKTTAAFIYYVGPSWSSFTTQIDAVMPSSTPAGAGTIIVTQNGISTPTFPVTVTASSPGAYSLNGAGSGPGVFYNVAADGSTEQNSLFHTAKPGQIAALYETGLGPAANPSLEGMQPPTQVDVRDPSFLVDVWVGNRQASVLYAGRSSYTAEDEIDFIVPSQTSGCYNEVAVYAGPPGQQTVSNFTTLSVDHNGSVCRDADGINMNDLSAAIGSKGTVSVGAIGLISSYLYLTVPPLGPPLPWDNDTVNGEIVTLTTQQLDASIGLTYVPSVNSCAVIPFLQYPSVVPIDPVLAGAFGAVAFLDAGSELSILGPNGTASVPKDKNVEDYAALVGGETIGQLILGCPSTSTSGCAPFFLNALGWGTASWTYSILPGTYTVSAPGGSNVGAFSGNAAVSTGAASFQWTNQGSIGTTISRGTPLTITWTGGDPHGFVDIAAIASTLQSGEFPAVNTPGTMVECIAPASAGSFTIPVYVLQSLPSTANSTALLPPGQLQVGPVSGATKVSPAPAGLDAAYLFYRYIAGANVTWQ